MSIEIENRNFARPCARRLRFGILAGLAVVAVNFPAHATLIQLQRVQDTVSVLDFKSVDPQNPPATSRIDFQESRSETPVQSSVLDGVFGRGSQARMAGRAGGQELTANAAIRNANSGSPFVDYDSARGEASLGFDVHVLTPTNVTLDFFLPPGFLQLQTSVEVGSRSQLSASLLARIRMERLHPNPSDERVLFEFDAELSGDARDFELTSNAAAPYDPGLDTSALTHDNVVVTDLSAGESLYTWKTPAFAGSLDLGAFGPSENFRVRYFMGTIAEQSIFSGGTFVAASLNDPFMLSDDPQFINPIADELATLPPVSFMLRFDPALQDDTDTVSVPEPASSALLAAGLGLLVAMRRRRKLAKRPA